MVRWHEAEAEMSTQRRASAAGGVQRYWPVGGQQEEWRKTAVDESKEMADRVARHQVYYLISGTS